MVKNNRWAFLIGALALALGTIVLWRERGSEDSADGSGTLKVDFRGADPEGTLPRVVRKTPPPSAGATVQPVDAAQWIARLTQLRDLRLRRDELLEIATQSLQMEASRHPEVQGQITERPEDTEEVLHVPVRSGSGQRYYVPLSRAEAADLFAVRDRVMALELEPDIARHLEMERLRSERRILRPQATDGVSGNNR